MTDHYRGNPNEQSAMSRFWRQRWQRDSIYVLDIDRLVVSRDLKRGMLIEEKHQAASEKNWRITQTLAHRLGYWAALLEYTTDDGSLRGNVTDIAVTWRTPDGWTSSREPWTPNVLDWFVCEQFGAKPR